MKRTLTLFGILLVIAAVSIVGAYLLRTKETLNQYVHPDSQALVSVSVDNIMLDHIGQFFKRRSEFPKGQDPEGLNLESLWSAGIHIPAQIHFFTLSDDPLALFTIQRIENLKKWENFIGQYKVDSIYKIDNSRELSIVHFSPSVSTLYNDQQVLFRFGFSNQNSLNALKGIWADKEQWTLIRDFNLHPIKASDAHISYQHTDGMFQLLANISKGHIELSGNWQLTNHVSTDFQARKPDMTSPFLSFWSSLPLSQTPLITGFLSDFSGVDETALTDHAQDYVDLFVYQHTTFQKDTVVVYDYDEDFNSIEKKEIQETPVPIVRSVWKGDEQLLRILPDKMFYRFNKTRTDSLLLLSTEENGEFAPGFVATDIPFHIQLDFSQIPSFWLTEQFRSFQEREIKVDIGTSVLNSNTLGIKGEIRYKEK